MIEVDFKFEIVCLHDHAFSLSSNMFLILALKKVKYFCEECIYHKEKQTCDDGHYIFLIM